jgi:hypothetical protein
VLCAALQLLFEAGGLQSTEEELQTRRFMAQQQRHLMTAAKDGAGGGGLLVHRAHEASVFPIPNAPWLRLPVVTLAGPCPGFGA